MNIYDREAALFNIQEIIVNKIKKIKPVSLEEVREVMQPLFNDRNEILLGNEDLIQKYKQKNKKGDM